MVAFLRHSTDRSRISAGASGHISATDLGNDQIFPAFDETERVGLLYRDLLGAGLAGMWSVDALIAEIAAAQTALHRDVAPAVRPRPIASTQLREWLAAAPAYGKLTQEDIETLSNDPPLPFFILFEAMLQPGAEGLRLGPLGSIMVSEVIFGALAGDLRSSSGDSLTDQLADLSREHYPANFFQRHFRYFEHGATGGVRYR